MSTHTPGPWAYDSDSGEIFSKNAQHDCGWIALVKGNDSNNTPLPKNERIANAALIAAAPAMLNALRIGLHHTHRAAAWTKDAYRRALEDGMHGTADAHHAAWMDTLAAIKVIEAAISTGDKSCGD